MRSYVSHFRFFTFQFSQKPVLQPVDPYAAVGGLDKQIAEIRDLIETPLTRPEIFKHFGLLFPAGFSLDLKI